jgi:N-acetylmuramic acid 6-phosphate etherase
MNNQKETNNGAFIKISEQPSLYNNLEKKSVREILDEINTKTKGGTAVQRAIPQIEKYQPNCAPHETRRSHLLHGSRHQRPIRSARCIGNPPYIRHAQHTHHRIDCGGDTALRNPVENAEDDMERGWQELQES